MSCCGGSATQSNKDPRPGFDPRTGIAARAHAASATFQYLGVTALTVIGPMTQKVYLFNGPGAQLSVDARDARSLAALPLLKAV